MSKVRKKKPLGTPGGSFLATNRNKPPSLSAPTESEMNEIDKETIENDDATQELLKGDYEINIFSGTNIIGSTTFSLK